MVIKGAEKLCTLVKTLEELGESVRQDNAVLLFMAEGSVPCHNVVKDYNRNGDLKLFLDTQRIKCHYVDTAEDVIFRFAQGLGVVNIPYYLFFSQRKFRSQHTGYLNEKEFRERLNQEFVLNEQRYCLMNH